MNAVGDRMKSTKRDIIITSGSFGEGLDMRGSDLDLMFVTAKDIEVYENDEDIKTDNYSSDVILSMETDDVKAGFTQLLVKHVKHTNPQNPCKYFEELNGKHYLSSALYKQYQLANTCINSVIHGPCISDKEGMFDKAKCLHCTTWTSQASQWITRSNSSWPSYNVKQSIIKHGVLFVPIGVKGSPKEDIEWRISFSVVCLHYFIPENNMFENKIEGRAREILLGKLYTLHSYGWRCILFSDQISNIHVSMWMNHIKPHTLHTIELANPVNSKLLYLASKVSDSFEEDAIVYKRGIHQIVSYHQSSPKYMYTYYLSKLCGQYAQYVQLSSSRNNNEQQYKQYKSCLCTLLQNIYHDSVSGWLILASFFYKAKQYSNALHIIAYSISKCTPEKVCHMDMSGSHFRFFDLQLSKKTSIVQLWKIMFIDNFEFAINSQLIPNELQMEIENGMYWISSIVYAYFLKMLCHYHLNNVIGCQDCVQTFQLVLAEKFLIENNRTLYSGAYNILGIALQLLGDNESARQAFMRSVDIYPNNEYNTAIKRLSLIGLM
ncbi:Hypothetical predicted protein [Mytilus galloprovincialis]|uniref:Uncharacterized protein n=1 Tax=Mytilus galloprovincialis TaxID=29158 RepID=A0A8B6FXH5_MYTGA|nr:Hypothetical predicted protein [Mytilus galloprovincialis]